MTTWKIEDKNCKWNISLEYRNSAEETLLGSCFFALIN